MRKYAKVGEKVRLINLLQFIRCGYPLSSRDIDKNPDLNNRKWQMMNAAALALLPNAPKTHYGSVGISGWLQAKRDDNSFHYNIDPRISYKLESAVNMAILIENNFGGNKRIVVEEPIEILNYQVGTVLKVTKKRFVKTGKRYPSRSWTSYEGEHEYEPGGLENEQTHCVYELDGWFETLAKNTERIFE